MRVIIKRPGEVPEETQISNTLNVLQQAVGGNIEVLHVGSLYYGAGVALEVNEEGKLLDVEPNLVLLGDGGRVADVIAGTVVAVGTAAEDFTDLTDLQACFAKDWLSANSIIRTKKVASFGK